MLWVSSEQDSVSVLQGLVLLGREVTRQSNKNILSTEKCYEESEKTIHRIGRAICKSHICECGLNTILKDLYSEYIKNALNSTVRKQIRKWENDLNKVRYEYVGKKKIFPLPF